MKWDKIAKGEGTFRRERCQDIHGFQQGIELRDIRVFLAVNTVAGGYNRRLFFALPARRIKKKAAHALPSVQLLRS